MRKTWKTLLTLLLALVLLAQIAPGFTARAEDVIGAVRINSGSNAKVRDRASFDGRNVGEAKAGKEYDLLENTGEWYKIRLDEKTVGWIYNSTAQVIEKKEGSASKAEPTATPAPTSAPQKANKETEAAPVSVSLGAVLHNKPVILTGQGGLTITVTNIAYSDYGDYQSLHFVLEASNANDRAVLVDFDPYMDGVSLNGNRYECVVSDSGQMNFMSPASFTVPAQTEKKYYQMSLYGYEASVPAPEEIENGEFLLTVYDAEAKSALGGITYQELFKIGPIRFDMAYDGPAEETKDESAGIVIPIVQVENEEALMGIAFEPMSAEFSVLTITVEKAGWYIREYNGNKYKLLSVYGTLENGSSRSLSSMDLMDYCCLLMGGSDFKTVGRITSPLFYDPDFDIYGNFEAKAEHVLDAIPAQGKVRFSWAEYISVDESFSEIDCYLANIRGTRASNPFRFVEQ